MGPIFCFSAVHWEYFWEIKSFSVLVFSILSFLPLKMAETLLRHLKTWFWDMFFRQQVIYIIWFLHFSVKSCTYFMIIKLKIIFTLSFKHNLRPKSLFSQIWDFLLKNHSRATTNGSVFIVRFFAQNFYREKNINGMFLCFATFLIKQRKQTLEF